MKRCTTETCSITLPLITEKWQADRLDRRFELGRKLYNTLLCGQWKICRNLMRREDYQQVMRQLGQTKDRNSAAYRGLQRQRGRMLRDAGFSEYGFVRAMTPLYGCYRKNIDSNMAQAIAKDVWRAYEAYFFGNGRRMHPKRFGQMNCLSGQRSRSSIRFLGNHIWFNGLEIPVKRDFQNTYESEMLMRRIKFCRVLRKWIKNRYRYFVQIVLEGRPALKRDRRTGGPKHPMGDGPVGCFISAGAVIYAAERESGFIKLPQDTKSAEKRRLQRRMERSLKAMNPSISKPFTGGGRVRLKKSRRFLNLQRRYRELCRIARAEREIRSSLAVLRLLCLGSRFQLAQGCFHASEKGAAQFFRKLEQKVQARGGPALKRVEMNLSQLQPSADFSAELYFASLVRDSGRAEYAQPQMQAAGY